MLNIGSNINHKKPKRHSKSCRCKICKWELINNNKLINTSDSWINSYKNNNNTGKDYEICVGIAILLGGKLIKKEDLPEQYKKIKPYKTSRGLKGIINLTQTDNIGGTADICLVFKGNKIRYYSVTKSTGKKLGKCIFNPSGSKYYGLSKTPELEIKNDEAFNLAVKYRKENYGQTPNKNWKRTPKCPGSKMMGELLAKKASNTWMSMSEESRKENLVKMLDLDNTHNTNADGIIYWNKKKQCIEEIYKWRLAIDLSRYLTTYNEGIYIYHGTPEDYILKTQAKYNNGIIEGMKSKIPIDQWTPKKSASYLSSWDCNAPDLNKIFKMKYVKELK